MVNSIGNSSIYNYGTYNIRFANAGTNANSPVLIEGYQRRWASNFCVSYS